MYCSHCGAPVGTESYCQKCGAPRVVARVTSPAASGPLPAGFPRMVPLAYSRVARHVHTLGILWIVFAIYSVLRWLLVLPVLHVVFGGGMPWMHGPDTWAYVPFHPGGWLLHFIAIVVFARALLSLAVGFALLTRQPWGRMFAIVIAVLTLFKPILGTILAIYTLWVLLENSADQNYAQLSAERNAFLPPGQPL